MVPTADDNSESKWHSLPSSVEASGWNEGFPEAGGIAQDFSWAKASVPSCGCGHRATNADSSCRSSFQNDLCSLPWQREGRLRELAGLPTNHLFFLLPLTFGFESLTPLGVAWIPQESGCFPAGQQWGCVCEGGCQGTSGCFAEVALPSWESGFPVSAEVWVLAQPDVFHYYSTACRRSKS